MGEQPRGTARYLAADGGIAPERRQKCSVWRQVRLLAAFFRPIRIAGLIATVVAGAFGLGCFLVGIRPIPEVVALREASGGAYWEAVEGVHDAPTIWEYLDARTRLGFAHITELTTAGYDYPTAADPIRKTEANRFWGAVGHLPRLRWLDVYGGPLSDSDLGLIAESSTLAYINLAGTNVTERGLSILRRMPELRWVVVDSRTISAEAAASLMAARPPLAVHRSTCEARFDSGFAPPAPPAWLAAAIAEGSGPVSRWQAPLRAVVAPRIREKSDFQLLCCRPHIDFISFCDRPLSDDDLVGMEGLNTVVYLGLSRANVTAAGMVNLARLRCLIFLHIDDHLIHEGATTHLQRLKHLRFLALEGHTLSDAEFSQLTSALPGVEIYRRDKIDTQHLRLGQSFVTEWDGPAWAKELRNFKVFDMFDVPTGVTLGPDADDDDVRGISHLRKIVSANCSSAKVHGTALGELTQLKRLEINALGDEPDPWAFLSGLRALEDLQVWRNDRSKPIPPITDRALEAIAPLTELRELHLVQDYAYYGSAAKITAGGLAKLSGLHALRSLWLGGAPVDDAGVGQIARLPAIVDLWLQYTNITDECAGSLATMRCLITLNISHTRIGDEALRHILPLPNLQLIFLSDTRVTKNGAELLVGRPELKAVLDGRIFSAEERKDFEKRIGLRRVTISSEGPPPTPK
jgi:hypothetical protein